MSNTTIARFYILPLLFSVFLLSTTKLNAATYTWNASGPSNWSSSSSWSPSGTPGNGDDVIIGNGAIVMFTANSSAKSVEITGNVTFQLAEKTLTIGTLNIGSTSLAGVLSIDGQRAKALQINTKLSLNSSNSKLVNSQNISYSAVIEIGSNGQVYMYDIASCYVGNPGAALAANVQTNWNNNTTTALLSHVRFEGNLNLPQGLKLNQGWDLYLGETADLPERYSTNGTKCIETGVIPLSPNGYIRKQFTHVGQEFYFPVGVPSEKMTPITLKMESLGALTSAVPWPHVAVRVAYTSTGHPMSQQTHRCKIYWPVIGNGYACPGVSWSGLMEAHNQLLVRGDNGKQYNGGITFSARFFDNYENGTLGSGFNLTGSASGWKSGPIHQVPFSSMPCWGDFVIGAGDPGSDPIPVELTSFSARYVRDNVQLSWQTATELNNYGFAIERSRDGATWEEIDFVAGAGNSFSPKSYNYTDILDLATRRAPKLAYRLRQIDRDGTTEYSSIVFVTLATLPAGVTLYDAYPNPFNPGTTINFSLTEAGAATVKVYDIYGREVATLLDNATLDAGVHTVAFNASTLPSASYVVVLNAAGVSRQQRVVLSK